MSTTTYQVRISPAIADEYQTRDMAQSYDGPHNPYVKIDGPGVYEFTEGEALELRSDARHYSEPGGPGDYLTFGQRTAYRRLAILISAAIEISAAIVGDQ